MANNDKLPGSIQESIATAVAICQDRNSEVIAHTIEPSLLDPPFDDIVTRCLEYRTLYKRAPGKEHIDDVFADIMGDRQHRQHAQYNRIITAMCSQADGLNTNFVVAQVTEFNHKRLYRIDIGKLVERYQTAPLDELDDLARAILRIRHKAQTDVGFSMADDNAFNFLERDIGDYCPIGIKELDIVGCHPAKKELLLFIAARNKGKSFFLTHCGKYGYNKGWRTLHYTLENSADMTAMRYWQTLFSGMRRHGETRDYRYLVFDDSSNAMRLESLTLKPKFIIEDKEATDAFLNRMRDAVAWKLQNLRVREYPSGRLTIGNLERDLDTLALAHNFYPEMILLDMPQLMNKQNRNGQRDDVVLDELITNLRGIAVERGLAMVCPQQGNRSAERAATVRSDNAGATMGFFGVADNAITYSQTPAEEEHGLARLRAEKVRNDRARDTILITQHYPSGQFCMDSRRMTREIDDVRKSYIGQQNGNSDEDDDD